MSWNMIWPVMIVVMSNVIYNICQKSTPQNVNGFGALMITYMVAAAVTAVLFACTAGIRNMASEIARMNWSSFALGAAIVGLEIGYVYLYRNGWKVSAGSVVCNIALAVVLIFVGRLLYKEVITVKQLAGMVLCSAGLVLLTM